MIFQIQRTFYIQHWFFQKQSLKDIANLFNDLITCLPSRFKYFQWYLAPSCVLGCYVKLYPTISAKKSRKHMEFSNKAVELINPISQYKCNI